MPASQAGRRGFEPRLPLHKTFSNLRVRRNPSLGAIRCDSGRLHWFPPLQDHFEEVEEFFGGADGLRITDGLEPQPPFLSAGERGAVYLMLCVARGYTWFLDQKIPLVFWGTPYGEAKSSELGVVDAQTTHR